MFDFLRHGESTSNSELIISALGYVEPTDGVFQIARQTQYRNTNGTGGQTTKYVYTYDSGRLLELAIILPIVTTAQNGPNAAVTTNLGPHLYRSAVTNTAGALWTKPVQLIVNGPTVGTIFATASLFCLAYAYST